MGEQQLARTVTVANPQGLHARPADLFAKRAGEFQSTVTIIKDGMTVDGKSVLNILTLAAGQGTQLELQTVGPDAADALEALVTLVESNFENLFTEQEQAG